jgi:integrase
MKKKPPLPLKPWQSSSRRVLESYALWISRTGKVAGLPSSKQEYISERRALGADDGVLANTLGILKHVSNIQGSLKSLELDKLITALRRSKARSGGTKEKPLRSIQELGRLLQGTGSKRDLIFKAFWYILLASGSRPAELHQMEWTITDTALSLRYFARKVTKLSQKEAAFSFLTGAAPLRRRLRSISTPPRNALWALRKISPRA